MVGPSWFAGVCGPDGSKKCLADMKEYPRCDCRDDHFPTGHYCILQKFVGGLPKQLKSAECLTKPLRFGDGRQVYKTDCDRDAQASPIKLFVN
ncbi:hypothetical protein YC2023_115522 [Brassica napus]